MILIKTNIYKFIINKFYLFFNVINFHYFNLVLNISFSLYLEPNILEKQQENLAIVWAQFQNK